MTSRRDFFRSLAVATAALYLRIAPTTVRALEEVHLEEAIPTIYDDAFRFRGGMMVYRGKLVTCEEMLRMRARPMPPRDFGCYSNFKCEANKR